MTAAVIVGASGLALEHWGSLYSAYEAYEIGQDERDAAYDASLSALQNSQLQAEAARIQADADASEKDRQARLEEQRAGIEQIQGEREAEKRSRQMAASIGSLYANYAGNGLLVDGRPSDTLGAALRSEVAEGQADISTIRDNTAVNVWTRQQNASSLLQSASNIRSSGAAVARSYLVAGLNEYKQLRTQGDLAAKKGTAEAITTSIVSTGQALKGSGSLAISSIM